MSKSQTMRIAELEAKVKVYESIIVNSNFKAIIPEKKEIGFAPRGGEE